jgi:hypothetical protein
VDELLDTAGELFDGVDEILDTAGELFDGVDELLDTAGELFDGVDELLDTAGELFDVVDELGYSVELVRLVIIAGQDMFSAAATGIEAAGLSCTAVRIPAERDTGNEPAGLFCTAAMGKETTGLLDKGNPRVWIPEDTDTVVRRIALTGTGLWVAPISMVGVPMLGDTADTVFFSGVRFGTIMTVRT